MTRAVAAERGERERTPLARLAGIDKRFDAVQALDGVDFEIAAGEIVGLIGANGAGKSTLMRVLAGAERPDAGTVHVDGRPVRLATPRQALDAGIARVPQELTVVADQTVTENVLLGRLPRLGGVVRGGEARATTVALLERVGLAGSVDPAQRLDELTPVQQKLVTIAQALASRPRLLILDEPTAALPTDTAERLLAAVRELARSGVAVVHVSHRLDEVRRLCDRVVAMRDGRVTAILTGAGIEIGAMVVALGGRALAEEPEAAGPAVHPGEPVLRARGLCGRRVRDVDLEVRAGEVLGIGGLYGSGRSELLRLLGAAQAPTGGRLELDGAAGPRSPREAIDRGVAYLPEGRAAMLFGDLSVQANVSISALSRFRRLGAVIDGRAERRAVAETVGELALVGDLGAPVTVLSGGNQQKVCLARWLLRGSRVLLLDEPSVGIDVHARAELHHVLRRLAQAGTTVVMASAEPEELALVCERVVVLVEGRIARELRSPFSSEAVVAASYAGAPG